MEKLKYLPKTRIVERKAFLIEMARNKSVVHLGCAGGFIDEKSVHDYINNFSKNEDTHSRIAEVAKSIVGVDISADKLSAMKNAQVKGDLFTGDITSPSFSLGNTYEIIIFANLIEHLDNVKFALENCKKMMKPDSKLIITTNNAFDIKVILKLLFNYESTNIEHTAYYSYLTLKRLLAMNELRIANFYYATNKRHGYDGVIDKLSYHLGNLFAKIFKQYSQELIIIAQRRQ